MRVVKIPEKGGRGEVREILSPWLRAEDAARYLGVSRSFFDSAAAAANLPHGFEGRTKVYNTDELDKLCQGGSDEPRKNDHSDRDGS